jgi:hypothetical protein
MALSPEFKEFYSSWMKKAQPHGHPDLRQSFDRFFTLYVVFNRLYAEATFRLWRKEQVQLASRNRFPDSEAAQEYVVQYVGAAHLLQALNNDPNTRIALESIRAYVCDGTFSFKLNMMTGEAQPDEDRRLCQHLTSADRNKQAVAILEILYAIRCNMFHGHKGFESIQARLLNPVTIVLEELIKVVYVKLDEDDD